MGFILGAREGGAWAFVQVSLPPGRAWEGPSQPHRGSGREAPLSASQMRGRKQSERLTPQPQPPSLGPSAERVKTSQSPPPTQRRSPAAPYRAG